MSYSKSYSQNAFRFAFKESEELAEPITRLMSPFEVSLWVSIAILLIVSISAILLTKKLPLRQRHYIIGGRMNRTPILNMMNALMGNAISNPRMARERSFGLFTRLLFLIWIFFWLIVRNSYQGSLYETLQSQRVESPFDTIEKVQKSRANIYVTAVEVNLVPEEFDRNR